MNKKVLFIAKVAKGHILAFHLPYLKMLKEMGCKIHVATSDRADIPFCDKQYVIPFENTYVSINNIRALFMLKKIMTEEGYDLIHTHTSVAGAIGRLAFKVAGSSAVVLHTAHGFPMYAGQKKIKYFTAFFIEWFCSIGTEAIITMNEEDFILAKKTLKARNVYFIDGIGVNLTQIRKKVEDFKQSASKNSFKCSKEDVLLVSVGELSKRKNHAVMIRTIHKLINEGYKNLQYIICGTGSLHSQLQCLINQLNLQNNVHLIGYRSDIVEILCMADIFVFPSIYEGLPVSVIEAMAAGLPVVASKIRGNKDLITNNENGYLCGNHVAEYEKALIQLLENTELQNKFAKRNVVKSKLYDIEHVEKEMRAIYETALLEKNGMKDFGGLL